MTSPLLLAVQAYPACSHRLEAHWPFYEKAGADLIIGIGTDGGGCKWPKACTEHVEVGADCYISNSHLPKRLIDTMRFMLCLNFERFCIIEWDCLFFQPLPVIEGLAAFHAGNQLDGMRTQKFYHTPWCFDVESGNAFLKKADELLPLVSGHECSPDVFFGWVCQEAGLPVAQPWTGFTRNTIESAADAELARDAYRNGAMAIHGIKSRATLDHVMS